MLIFLHAINPTNLSDPTSEFTENSSCETFRADIFTMYVYGSIVCDTIT